MRALHVLDCSLPEVVAGYTVRSHAILRAQREWGMTPAGITGMLQPQTDASDAVEIDGVAYHRTTRTPAYDAARTRATRDRIFANTLRARVLQCAAAHGAELVHGHSPSLVGLAGYLAAKRAGLPSVYEVRAFWEDADVSAGRCAEGSPEYLASQHAETRLAREVDRVVTISRGLRRDLMARGIPEDKVALVPNGVDTARRLPVARDEALAHRLGLTGKVVIGYAGSFFGFEGLRHLIDALGRLLSTRDDVRGLVVGDGEVGAALRKQAKALGDRVIFTGKQSPQDAAAYYGVMDILCYPRERCRLTELTTPLKPLEAMSMAKAVVASDVGGHRELMDDEKTARLFRAGDAEDLARVLRQLVASPAERARLGEAARADVVDKRDWTVVVRRYADVYAAAQESSRRRAGQSRTSAA